MAASPRHLLDIGRRPAFFNETNARLKNNGLLALLLVGEDKGIVCSAALAAGILNLPLMREGDALLLINQVEDAAMDGNLSDAEVNAIIPRSLGLVFDGDAFPPWTAHRLDPTSAATLLGATLCLAEDYAPVVDACYQSLGMLGTRAVIAMRAASCFDTELYEAHAAITARVAYREECAQLVAKFTTAGYIGARPVDPSAERGAAPAAALEPALAALTAAVNSIVTNAATTAAHRMAIKSASSKLTIATTLGANPVQLAGCFTALPVRTVATVYAGAGLDAPALTAAADARAAAVPLGHPPGFIPLGGNVNPLLTAPGIMNGLNAGFVGGQAGFGGVLPPAGALLPPPPGTPLPSRYIAPGGIAYCQLFLVDPEDPDEVLKAQAQEMVVTLSGGYVPKIKSTTVKPLEDEWQLLLGGGRLGMWKVATGQWAQAVQVEHMHYLHKIVELKVNGHDWEVVREIERKYRVGMHTGKYSSWDCGSTLATLVVLSAKVKPPKRAAPAPNPGAGGNKKQKGGKGAGFVQAVHKKDSSGTVLCKNWNVGIPCRGPGNQGSCTLGHTCFVCLKNHKACDHH